MKRTAWVLLLTLALAATTFADGEYLVYGVRYDASRSLDKTMGIVVGGTVPISGNLYLTTLGEMGSDAAARVLPTYWLLKGKFSAAVLLGASSSWEGDSNINYLSGATGGLLTYQIMSDAYLWTAYNYMIPFTDNGQARVHMVGLGVGLQL